jgi:hypothetical protein
MEEKAAAQPTELKPTAGGELATETLRPTEHAPESAEGDHESPGNAPSTSAASPQGTSQHATATPPDLSAEASSRHGTTPDLSTEASIPHPQLPSVAEIPPEVPVITSEPPASSLSDTMPPPVVTARLPSSEEEQMALPPDTPAAPLPVRKPALRPEVRSPPTREATAPKEDKKSVILNGEVKSTPDRAGTRPKRDTKTVVQKVEGGSKPDRSPRAKGQSFVDKKVDHDSGSGAISDVLAGGL